MECAVVGDWTTTTVELHPDNDPDKIISKSRNDRQGGFFPRFLSQRIAHPGLRSDSITRDTAGGLYAFGSCSDSRSEDAEEV